MTTLLVLTMLLLLASLGAATTERRELERLHKLAETRLNQVITARAALCRMSGRLVEAHTMLRDRSMEMRELQLDVELANKRQELDELREAVQKKIASDENSFNAQIIAGREELKEVLEQLT